MIHRSFLYPSWKMQRSARLQSTGNRQQGGSKCVCRPPVSVHRRYTTVLLMALPVAEIEQVEQVANRRHVGWDVRIVTVKPRIGQIVAAAVAERGVEHPVPFNELNERGMLGVNVADVTAHREGGNSDNRNARPGAEEIDGLDKAGVVVAAALVYSHEDGGLGPLLRIALREFDDVSGEGFEEPPLGRSRVAVQRAIRHVYAEHSSF